ncbi:MAG TPA: hypothetical protein VLL98_05270 [Rickettsiales bacterium]|nr:hypothetical protein [Rickettsiales bacterium]HSQ98095.1 hypothetical protein [Rickettsiales bacterium]
MVKFVNLQHHYFQIIKKSKDNYKAILFEKRCIGFDVVKGQVEGKKIEIECWIGAMKEIYL